MAGTDKPRVHPLLLMLRREFPGVFKVDPGGMSLTVVDRDFFADPDKLAALEHAHPTPLCRTCGDNPVKDWGSECLSCAAKSERVGRGTGRRRQVRATTEDRSLEELGADLQVDLQPVATAASGWVFAAHALERLAERQLDAVAVLRAVQDPAVTRPGERPEAEVRERDGVQAVVVPERRLIITVAWTDRARNRPPQ